MLAAMFFLVVVLGVKGLAVLFQPLTLFFVILGWVLAFFLSASLVIDIFRNVPQTLKKKDYGDMVDPLLRDWRRRYMYLIGVSLVVRVATLFLLFQWFVLPVFR